MMREIKKVRQNSGEDQRRWFTDEYWDLYVWQNHQHEITGVQLAYGKPFTETAFTWTKNGRFENQQVNSQKVSFMRNTCAPVLTKKKSLNKDYVLRRFIKDSSTMEPRIINFVTKVLKKF